MHSSLRPLHLAAALLLLLGTACFGSANRQAPRNAEVMAPARLAGLWEGTYRARTVARDGRVRVNFEQRGDSLVGWLELLGIAAEQLRAPLAVPAARAADVVRVELPTITLDGTQVRMHSAGDWDPGCGCTLTLDLTGFVVGDTLSGYFDAIGTAVTAPERGGRWQTVRVR